MPGTQPKTRRDPDAHERNGLGRVRVAELRPRAANTAKTHGATRSTEPVMRLDVGGGRRYAAKSAFLVLASHAALATSAASDHSPVGKRRREHRHQIARNSG